jgi:hypothetical protein
MILQVHFQIGGNYPTEQPAEPRDIISNLFRAQDLRGTASIGRTTVLTIVPRRVTEETETETETEMVQSDIIGRNKSQSLSMGVF